MLIPCSLMALLAVATARDVLELAAVNFEIALTDYKYAAILFYDSSENGQGLKEKWIAAAGSISSLHEDAEIAKIDSDDPDLKELIDAYSITVPCIKVFRRGIMGDYRGPTADVTAMADFLKEDSQPSVQMASTLDGIKALLKNSKRTVVLGFFEKADMLDDDTEAYHMSASGQFQAAADALRGHAAFYAVESNESLLESFRITKSELPVVYMISEEGDGLIPYSGEIMEMNLTEWVLRHSSPAMAELSFSSPSGEMYATQFFSSRKLKFILFLSNSKDINEVVSYWRNISDTFKNKAIFSYMIKDGVPDVLEYFSVDPSKHLPMVVAHDPTRDYKYRSVPQLALSHDSLLFFVSGVMTGTVKRVLKSEPAPQPTNTPTPVVKAVGSNVVDVVSAADKDVMLVVYRPWCTHCKKLMPTYDIFARAVHAEDRIIVAKIDGVANDVPPSWGVKSYPTILWFPAKDKPYSDVKGPIPRPYWDAGQTLHVLVSFVQRQGSFDAKTLRVATQEQLGSLLGDEDTLRAKYDLDEKNHKRNEGREIFEHPMLDYAAGEIVFDGKRWHLALVGVLALAIIALTLVLVSTSSALAAFKKGSTTMRKKKG